MTRPSELGATVEHPALCLRCGYELRGLAMSGLCPECGFAVLESLEHRRLGLSSHEYLASLRTGAALAIGALAVLIAAGFARLHLLALAFAPGTQKYFVGLDGLGTALLIGGVWMLTIDDPGLHEKDQARANKRAMRAAATGLLAIAVAEFLIALRVPLPVGGPGTTPLSMSLFALGVLVISSLGSLACWLILATGLVNYCRWLAVRVPDAMLLRMAGTMSWLLPAAIVIAFAASLFFGSATRLLPLGLMVWLVGAARERIRPGGS